MDALGASIFTFKRREGPARHHESPDWTMLKFSGTVESAFDSEAWRIRLAAYGARLERVLG